MMQHLRDISCNILVAKIESLCCTTWCDIIQTWLMVSDLNPESSCLPELVAEGKWDSTFVVTPIIHVGGRVWPHYRWTHKHGTHHRSLDHSDLWSQVVRIIVSTFCYKVLYLVDIDWTLISWNKKVLSVSVFTVSDFLLQYFLFAVTTLVRLGPQDVRQKSCIWRFYLPLDAKTCCPDVVLIQKKQ